MWNDARVRYDMELRRECVQFGMQRDDDLFLEKMEARFGSFHYLKDEICEIGTIAIVLRSSFSLREVRCIALSHWRKLYTRAPTANTVSTLERLRKTLTS